MATPASPPSRAPGLFFILATMFLDVMGLGISIPVGPHLVASFFNGDFSQAATYVGAMGALYTAMMFLCSPLLGALSDRFGRKPVLLVALAASAAGYLLTACAPNLGWLLASRVLSGLGGASLTVAQTYIADVSAPADRAKNYGLSGAAFGLGFIVGPAIGGLMGSWGDRVPFYAAALVTLLNLAYGALVVPESHAVANRRPFTWKEANPLGWVVTLRRHPAVLAFATALVWVWLGQQALQSNWVLYTSYRFHWTPTENGISLALVGITTVIVQAWLLRLLLPKLGEQRAILFGLLLGAAGLWAYGLATQGWMMYAILLGTAIAGIAGPTLQGQISRQVGPSEQGAIQGAMTSLMSLTGIVGPMVASGLFAYFTSPAAPVQIPGVAFFFGGACSLLGAVAVGRLFKAPPVPETEGADVPQPATF